jgi:hypothetical protein
MSKIIPDAKGSKMRRLLLSVLLICAGSYPACAGGPWWIDGHLDINEGDIYDGQMFIIDYGSVDVFGGDIGKLETWGYSTAAIYGGTIDILYATKDSVVDLHKAFDVGKLGAFDNSIVNIYTDSFTLSTEEGEYGNGYIEGTYYNTATTFHIPFYHENTYLHVRAIPEPATLLLVAIGGLLVSKRNHPRR